MIYLDNAATSWPKPAQVVEAMVGYMRHSGGNPGRSGHQLSVDAGRIVYNTREAIAKLFNVSDPLRVILTMNATHALNIALMGMLKAGDRVVTTSVEHNSVMRPLRALEKQGVELEIVNCDPSGKIDIADWQRALAGGAKLAVAVHASNVTGRIFPIAQLAQAAHSSGSKILVDAAQTAGVEDIDMEAMDIDMLAFTGHKALLGPQGTGGLVLGKSVDPSEIDPIMRGGTGSASASEEHPDFLPDKFESGTPNGVGIAGLGTGVCYIAERGLDNIRAHHNDLMLSLVSGLAEIDKVRVYGPSTNERRAGLVSFRIEGYENSDIGLTLDEKYEVMCRVGLHCATTAHKTLGTFPDGTVRFSISPLTTASEIDQALQAVKEIVSK
ncbi:aminotransferase class V-fold PLP-dependent enzyme [bacterium]|nr:aminotransferase class V-fold PLP-dependent enzyme [bacterium]